MSASDAIPVPRKNVAYRFYFAIRKPSDSTLITMWSGADSEVSLNGGAFADCTNESTEIGTSGCGFVDLTAAEMNADCVVLKVTVTNTGAVPLVFVLYPESAGDYRVDAANSSVGSVSGAVGSVTGAVGSVTGSISGNVTGSVGSVVAGVTVTSNNDKAGYSLTSTGLDLVSTWTVNITGSLSGAVGSVTGAVGSVTGNVGGNVNGNVVGSVASVTGNLGGNVAGNVSGSVGSVTGSVGSVTGSVGSVTGNVGGSVASVAGVVGSVAGNVGGDVSGKVLGGGASTITGDGVRAASVTGAVGSVTGAVGSVVGAVGSVTAPVALDSAALRTALGMSAADLDVQLDAILAASGGVMVLRGGLTHAGAIDLLVAAAIGLTSQPDSNNEKFLFRDGNDSFTTTFDSNGNRTAVVLH